MRYSRQKRVKRGVVPVWPRERRWHSIVTLREGVAKKGTNTKKYEPSKQGREEEVREGGIHRLPFAGFYLFATEEERHTHTKSWTHWLIVSRRRQRTNFNFISWSHRTLMFYIYCFIIQETDRRTDDFSIIVKANYDDPTSISNSRLSRQ